MYTHIYSHIYIYTYMYIYIIYVYTMLEIDGVASQNDMNQLWGNCESLWQSESYSCESLLADRRFTFQMVSQKDPF